MTAEDYADREITYIYTLLHQPSLKSATFPKLQTFFAMLQDMKKPPKKDPSASPAQDCI